MPGIFTPNHQKLHPYQIWRQNRKELPNGSTNNGYMGEKAKRDLVSQ